MADEKIDDLFNFIYSTTESIKILGDMDLPQVKEAIYGNKPLPENCPSRASYAEFCLRGLKGRVEEATDLITELEKEIFAQYSDKK